MDPAGNASDSDQSNSHDSSNHDDSLSDEFLPDLSISSDKDLTSADEDLDDKTFLKELKLLFGRSIKRKRMNKGRQDKTKRSRKVTINLVSPRATSRCNLSYFYKIIKQLSETQKHLIIKVGFGALLQFVYCAVPRLFVKWIARNVDVKNKDILVEGKRIPLNPLSVNNVLGIPLGGKDVSSTFEDAKASFLALFGCSTIPTIKFFGRKILKGNLTDDEFIRCFMVVALSTFLCPTSSTLPSPKYLGALLVIDDIKNYDWSKYVLDWLICYIEKYQKALLNMSRTRTLRGCIYDLAVYYLDFMDFGDHVVPATIPRISV